MRIITGISVACLLFANQYAAFCQSYDFDSLFRHDESFRTAVRSRPDSNDIFNGTETLKITITSDYKNLIRRKYQGEYQPAILVYHINDTVDVRREIEIKPRGNMRRKTCYFPPVTLNFPKKEAVLPQIREFDKMKMVVECKKGETFGDYILSEFYAYRLYNFVTDYSFRVRLIELTMVDANDNMKSMTTYAFLIESVDQVAGRMNAVPIETQNVQDRLTEPGTLALCYLFQYMIGNTDWSIPGQHNIKLIKANDPSSFYPVAIPYDFDYAGIVNTEYAVPDERLGIQTVRERKYRGVCLDEKYMRAAAEKLISAKDRMLGMYESSLLKPHLKRSALGYLDEFFAILEHEPKFKYSILEQCR
jgi:hypothetical protein